MRKILALILILAMVLPLCACNAANAPTTQNTLETVGTTAAPATTLPLISSTSMEPAATTMPTEPAEPVGELRTDVITTQPRLWETRSQLYGIVMKLDMPDDSYPGMVITFDLSATYAELWSRTENLGSRLTIENHQELYWRNLGDPAATREYLDNGGAFFVTAVIRADGNIVGYGLLEIGSIKAATYGPVRCETVCFPITSGQLQDVSEEYVLEKLAEAQKIRTPFDRDAKREEEWAYLFGDGAVPEPAAAPDPAQTTIHISAPFDIFAADPEAAGDVQMHVQEGYQFLKHLPEDSEDYGGYYLYYVEHTSLYNEILLWPGVLDEDVRFMPLTYEARTNYGALYNYSGKSLDECYEGQQAMFVEFLRWKGISEVPKEERMEKPERIWIDIIVRANGCVVGFMVLEIVHWDEYTMDESYTVLYRYSEGYQMIDGHYQNITEEFVNARIEACHQYFMNNAE